MSEKPIHQHLTHDQMMNTNPDEPFVKSSMTHEQELHVESHAPYLKVFAALAVFTAIEYFYARIFKDSFAVLVLGLMFWAVIKASMVGWYFMHLKFEGKWVYYMLVPAGILAIILTTCPHPRRGDAARDRGEPRGGGVGHGLAPRDRRGPADPPCVDAGGAMPRLDRSQRSEEVRRSWIDPIASAS